MEKGEEKKPPSKKPHPFKVSDCSLIFTRFLLLPPLFFFLGDLLA